MYLLQGDADTSHSVVVWSALQRREDCKVDLLLQVIQHFLAIRQHLLRADAIEDQTTTRTALTREE